MVAILGSMQYTFGALNHKQIFLGTSDDIITGIVGIWSYSRQLESDGYRLFYLTNADSWGVGWPFMPLTRKREETDLTGNVVRMQLSKMMGTNFNIDMALASPRKKKHRIGGGLWFNGRRASINDVESESIFILSRVTSTS